MYQWTFWNINFTKEEVSLAADSANTPFLWTKISQNPYLIWHNSEKRLMENQSLLPMVTAECLAEWECFFFYYYYLAARLLMGLCVQNVGKYAYTLHVWQFEYMRLFIVQKALVHRKFIEKKKQEKGKKKKNDVWLISDVYMWCEKFFYILL